MVPPAFLLPDGQIPAFVRGIYTTLPGGICPPLTPLGMFFLINSFSWALQPRLFQVVLPGSSRLVFGCLPCLSPIAPYRWPPLYLSAAVCTAQPVWTRLLLFCVPCSPLSQAQPWVVSGNSVSSRKDSLKSPTDLCKVISPLQSPGKGQSRCHCHSEPVARLLCIPCREASEPV